MRLRDVPTPELRRILQDTEATAGADSPSVALLRQELIRRRNHARQEGRDQEREDEPEESHAS